MRLLKTIPLIFFLLLSLGCSNETETDNANPSSIQIGDYIFNFETEFTLEELQGIDSYVGNMNGDGITLSFDYGYYTGPVSNLPTNEYLVTEDEVSGHFRQIVKPVDSKTKFTRIHLYKISDAVTSPGGYNSLTVYARNLTSVQQEIVLGVFNSVVIAD